MSTCKIWENQLELFYIWALSPLALSLPIVSTTTKIRYYLTGYISRTKNFQELSLLPLERAIEENGRRLTIPNLHTRDVAQKIVNYFWEKCKTSGKKGVK